MSISDKKMSLEGNANLLEKITKNFYKLAKANAKSIPSQMIYVISDVEESPAIKRCARVKFFNKLKGGNAITKFAFDTRRVNQKVERNPRANLQNWHRSDPFITKELDKKINIFAKLNDILNKIESEYIENPDYIGSYASELHEHVKRGLRNNINDGDYSDPHFSYLEQLIFARYRLSKDDLEKQGLDQLKTAILAKDEKLLKRGDPKISISSPTKKQLEINGNSSYSHENIVQALFGGSHFRKDNEKRVERTITITISDEVKE